jgi:hypothetical protein
MCYRYHLGPVSGPLPEVEEAAESKALETAGEKKPTLGSIINIRDFELAAPKLLPSKSFACEYSDIPRYNIVLTCSRLQSRCRQRVHLTLEPRLLASDSIPAPCSTAYWNN